MHIKKGLSSNFNASRTCQCLSNTSKGTMENILCKTANKVLKQYKNKKLYLKSQGRVSEMYLFIYSKLSSTIHILGRRLEEYNGLRIISITFHFRSSCLNLSQWIRESYSQSLWRRGSVIRLMWNWR